MRFDVYIETGKAHAVAEVNQIGRAFGHLLQRAPAGFRMNLHSSNNLLIGDTSVRTPWPLVVHRTVPLGADLNSWMQQQAAQAVVESRAEIAIAKGSPESIAKSVQLIAACEQAAASAAGMQQAPYLTAVLQHIAYDRLRLETEGLQQTLESCRQCNAGLRSLIAHERSSMEQLHSELEQHRSRNSSLRERLNESNREWDAVYKEVQQQRG